MFSFLRRTTPEISVDQLDEALETGAARLVDVREDGEFRRGHVPGAIHVPLADLPFRAAGLPRDGRLAVICESGHRSATATDYLLRQGFPDVASVRGGTSAWARSGRPLDRGSGSAG